MEKSCLFIKLFYSFMPTLIRLIAERKFTFLNMYPAVLCPEAVAAQLLGLKQCKLSRDIVLEHPSSPLRGDEGGRALPALFLQNIQSGHALVVCLSQRQHGQSCCSPKSRTEQVTPAGTATFSIAHFRAQLHHDCSVPEFLHRGNKRRKLMRNYQLK